MGKALNGDEISIMKCLLPFSQEISHKFFHNSIPYLILLIHASKMWCTNYVSQCCNRWSQMGFSIVVTLSYIVKLHDFTKWCFHAFGATLENNVISQYCLNVGTTLWQRCHKIVVLCKLQHWQHCYNIGKRLYHSVITTLRQSCGNCFPTL